MLGKQEVEGSNPSVSTMKIPIKKYTDDPNLSWEDRYERLMSHHREETSFLIGKVNEAERLLRMVGWAQEAAYEFVGELAKEVQRFLGESEEEMSAHSSAVEHRPDSTGVGGSIPPERTKRKKKGERNE